MKSVILYQIPATVIIVLLLYTRLKWRPFSISMPDYLMAIGIILILAGSDIIIFKVKQTAYRQAINDVIKFNDTIKEISKPVDNIKGI